MTISIKILNKILRDILREIFRKISYYLKWGRGEMKKWFRINFKRFRGTTIIILVPVPQAEILTHFQQGVFLGRRGGR